MANFDDSVNSAIAQIKSGNDTGNVTAAIGKSNSLVATSVYESPPKPNLVAVDAYGARAVNFINDTTAGAKGAYDGFFKNFKILGMAKDTIKSAATSANSVLTGVIKAKSQLQNYTGINLNSIPQLKDSLSTAGWKTITSATGIDVQSIMRDGSDVMRIAKGAAAGDVNTLMNAIQRLTNNSSFSEFVDLQAESAIFGELLGNATQLGATDVFDTLWDKVHGNDLQYGDNVAWRSVSENIKYVVANGDVAMMNKLIDKLGGSVIIEQYPEAIRDFLYQYTMPYGTDASDFPNQEKALREMFDRLDPFWYYSIDNGMKVYKLDPFIRASNVAVSVFLTSTDPDLATSALIGSSYPAQSSESLLRAYYPNIPL